MAVFESLWIVEIGRRLLAARAAEGDWPGTDVCEHRAVAEAVADREGDRAASLMLAHVRDALRHWGHDDAASDRVGVAPTLDRGAV